MWTSIHESPIFSWLSRPRSNTMTTQIMLDNYAPILGQHSWRPCRLALGGFGQPHYLTLISLKDFGQSPYSTVKKNFISFLRVGPSRHFPLDVETGIPQQLKTGANSVLGANYTVTTPFFKPLLIF
jgi:hypothetical protein